MEAVILSLALLIFLAHFFGVLFTKTRMPEVLPLMLLGILIGPVFHFVSPSDFGVVDRVFTHILLIVILFESGLGLRISHIRSSWAQSSALTAASFTLTLFSVAVLAKIVLGLSWPYAIILGSILAENSFAIILPLVSKLNISTSLKTVLSVESTVGSVLSIVLTITLLNMAKINSFEPSIIFGKIIYTFLISFIVGTAAAIFWTTVLNKVRKLENGIFLTLAFVMIVYAICETLGSDGAIGAFIFGIVAGNIRIIRKMHGFRILEHFTINVKSKAFNEVEKSFFSEVIFVLRTFFFVYIGIAIQITSVFSMLCGLLFTLVIFVIRIPVANFFLDKQVTRLDTAVAAALVPKGLITAVLASLVAQSGIIGGDILQDTIYSVILFSTILATLLSFCIEKGYVNGATDFLFKRHRPAPSNGAAPNASAPSKEPAKEEPENQERESKGF